MQGVSEKQTPNWQNLLLKHSHSVLTMRDQHSLDTQSLDIPQIPDAQTPHTIEYIYIVLILILDKYVGYSVPHSVQGSCYLSCTKEPTVVCELTE